MLYQVKVLWGNKEVTHHAWTLSQAKSWMAQYPNRDVLATVKRFGTQSIILVKYYR